MGALRRVLIANRGEIAIRIAQAAAALDIESVAVHPASDALSLHTRIATEARLIGGPDDTVAAYLDLGALVGAALAAGCDCVHPGYGFLAERADFAQACAAAGLVFVGPTASTLSLFGDKVRARNLAGSLGIPVVAGSRGTVAAAAAAEQVAGHLGYPVMLKAAAGGGGRGMRVVHHPDEMAEAFDRCRREAEGAFGDGSLFVECLLTRPRHVEVQILADGHGHVVHLHDRDCSVQLRHQKLVEVAPAPALDPGLRSRLQRDALAIGQEAGIVNAATVEFLVVPETGEHFFIECNPRIQVEHTVTEQVTGVDLVEAQFRLAAGASLDDLGLGTQEAVGPPRGFAVQARVVATGAGTLTAYKEPSGPGVRVDACGYVGYRPSPAFDPLLAKVIGWSAAPSVAAAVDRTRRALGEFHIAGLPTNTAALRTVLAHPAVRAGDARTTLLAEVPALDGADEPTGALVLLAEQAAAVGPGGASPTAAGGSVAGVSASPPRRSAPAAAPALTVGPGQQAVVCPMDGAVEELRVGVGDAVAAGATVLVISAMKMQTVVAAPCAGVIAAMEALGVGEQVQQGRVVAVVTVDGADGAAASGGSSQRPSAEETWTDVLDQIGSLQALAGARLAAGSDDPGVVRQRQRGKLTCRERIALLLDPGSFHEIGSAAGFASYDDAGRIAAFTPANHVGGWGTIGGRTVIVCADDFTSRGGHADGAIGAKAFHLDQLSVQLQVPSIRLLDGSSGGGSVAAMVPEQKAPGESTAQESSGAIEAGKPRVGGGGGSFLPGHLGSTEYTEQLATVPVANVLLGSVVGIGAAKAVLGHFSVMVRDIAQLFVAGPPVVRHAMGYDISKEELGGWHIHCRNGSVDNLADSEEEAAALTRRFLSYLPPSVFAAPPVHPADPDDPPDRRDEELFTIVPRRRTTTFDVRRAIELIVDRGSFFEIGPLWGTDQVTALVRLDGHPMGVIASDSRHPNGGALTADGCDKLRRHLDLCDVFHLPVLNLVDNPGFAVGLKHEIAGTIRRGGEWMVAFAQVRVPMFTVLVRRSFGVAGNNFATPIRQPSMRVAWPSADVGGIPPEGGIEAAYKRQLAEADDPEALRAELEARIERVRGPVGPLNRFQIEELIDPRDTRRLVCEWVPAAYRIVQQPARLGPRPLQFRP